MFRARNLTAMLTDISRRAPFRNWKLALANTYRFSEYYLYDIYTDRVLGGRNHFHIAERPFPVVDISLSVIRQVSGRQSAGRWSSRRWKAYVCRNATAKSFRHLSPVLRNRSYRKATLEWPN